MSPSPPPAPIGFYVHHHGSGHATRCRQIAAAWPDASPIHVFTSAPRYFSDWQGGTVHALPMDTEVGRDPAGDTLEGQIVHYAPVGLHAVSRRMATMATWIAERQPKLFVVDVSCEVTLFARLCGARVALVRLHGFRRDLAHVAAFQLADVLLAPFPPSLEDEHTETWVREKTIYLGLFSRYDDRTESKAAAVAAIGADKYRGQTLVTVVNGSGGSDRRVAFWEEVARDNPDHHFLLLGHLDAEASPVANVTTVGYAADTYPYLKSADVIVGSGGTNTMSEIGAATGRYLSLPEPRPFNEQVYKMRALERYGLTRVVALDADAKDWTKWLRRAGDLRPARWRELRSGTQLPNAVAELAHRCSGEGVGTTVCVNEVPPR